MKTPTTNSNFHLLKNISFHKKGVNSISLFPSGNIISVSDDQYIFIYDINFTILQEIENAHDGWIFYVNVKNENNFITCSYDKSIKFWEKNEQKNFILKEEINNAHNKWIYKVLYHPNGNLISCSHDKTIKIWEEEKNNKHICVTILKVSNILYSFLLLENKNLLIGCGEDEIIIWNLNNYEFIIKIEDAGCCKWNALNKLDNDRIIVGGIYSLMKVIDMNKKKVIKEIDNKFCCYGICVIENKGIFLTGGWSHNINVYRSDNYQCIQTLEKAHVAWIRGIVELNNNIIASFSDDGNINFWVL